jgi:hypothetical protein
MAKSATKKKPSKQPDLFDLASPTELARETRCSCGRALAAETSSRAMMEQRQVAGYLPSRALSSPPDLRFRPLDPGTEIRIMFIEGFEIRNAAFAQLWPLSQSRVHFSPAFASVLSAADCYRSLQSSPCT